MQLLKSILIIVILTVFAATAVQVEAGSISGTVTFKGKPRTPRPLRMSADPVCEALHGGETATDDRFTVGDSLAPDIYPLADVFVYVKSGVPDKDYPVPTEPLTIDQEGCRYIPHVAGVQVGQEIQFKNSDKTMHNVHSLAAHSGPFNRGMPAGSPNASYKLSATEVMAQFKCDAHPWMSCYIGAVPHPFFAVTGLDGKFTLDGLEDGEYEVEFWQELLGPQTAKITIANGTATLDHEFSRD